MDKEELGRIRMDGVGEVKWMGGGERGDGGWIPCTVSSATSSGTENAVRRHGSSAPTSCVDEGEACCLRWEAGETGGVFCTRCGVGTSNDPCESCTDKGGGSAHTRLDCEPVREGPLGGRGDSRAEPWTDGTSLKSDLRRRDGATGVTVAVPRHSWTGGTHHECGMLHTRTSGGGCCDTAANTLCERRGKKA